MCRSKYTYVCMDLLVILFVGVCGWLYFLNGLWNTKWNIMGICSIMIYCVCKSLYDPTYTLFCVVHICRVYAIVIACICIGHPLVDKHFADYNLLYAIICTDVILVLTGFLIGVVYTMDIKNILDDNNSKKDSVQPMTSKTIDV